MRAITLFTMLACLVSLRSTAATGQVPQTQSGKARLDQLIATKGNELETIIYLEGRGRVHGTLGASVAGIGDINQDGFDDVAVGNPQNGAGEVLILLGGAEMDSLPDMVLYGENEGDRFGSSIVQGDINGDNQADVTIAAAAFPNRTGIGRAYVYWGGAFLDSAPDVIIDGQQENSNWGLHLTTGDLAGDGQDWLLGSAPNYRTMFSRGKAYLYFISPEPNTLLKWSNEGDSLRSILGVNLAIGDLNGDGLKDLLINTAVDIGELGNDYLVVTEVFLNDNTCFDTLSAISITDNTIGNLANQVLLVGKYNSDDKDDLVVRKDGRLAIYLGQAVPDTIPDAHIEEWFGAAINRLANSGDVNGDGYPDILAGAWHPVFQTGSIGLYLGSESINSEVDWTAGGAGFSIDGAGDVNGDGYDDLIVSSLSLPGTNVAIGAVWVLAGRPDLVDVGTQVEDRHSSTPPADYYLFQNYPNPFKSQTTFCIQLANKFSKPVELIIYDITGKEVTRLLETSLPPGEHEMEWNGKDKYGKEVASGVYFSVLTVGRTHRVKKLVLVE